MEGLTYLVLGGLEHPPANGALLAFPRSIALAGALYRARVAAVMQVRTEFFCLLDGGGDELLPDFEASIDARIDALRATGKAIAYADSFTADVRVHAGEYSRDAYLRHPTMIHAGTVCRTAPAQSINWPDGCHWFEAVCYGTLAEQGHIYRPDPVYRWHPSPAGASQWPDTARAVNNSLCWLQGLPGAHFPKDFKD